MFKCYAIVLLLVANTQCYSLVYAESVEVRFSGELVSSVSYDAAPSIEGSFFYDKEKVETDVNALLIGNFVEVYGFNITTNGFTEYLEGGIISTLTPRFPSVKIPKLESSISSSSTKVEIGVIGAREPVAEQRIFGFDPVEEFKSATGLNPDASITEENLYDVAQMDVLRIEEEQIPGNDKRYLNIDPLGLLMLISGLEPPAPQSLPSVTETMIQLELSHNSPNNLTTMLSGFSNNEFSSLWLYGSERPTYSHFGFVSIDNGSSIDGYWGPNVEYKISGITVVETIPEPSSLAQCLICLPTILCSLGSKRSRL